MHNSQILTERQQSELNKAVLQYLKPILAEDTENESDGLILNQVANILGVSDLNSGEIIPNYLEKKWSTVLRLQKKIIDLESDIGNLKAAIDSQQSSASTVTFVSKDKKNWLPRSVSKSYETQANQLVQTVVVHPTLPSVMGGCSDGSIIVWNLTNDESLIPDKIIKAHTRNVNRIKWSNCPVDIINKDLSNPKYILASCSADLSIKIWDGSNYKHLRTLAGHEHTVSSIAFSESKPNVLYSVSRDKNVKIWDLTDGFCIKSFIGHSDWVRDLDVIAINSSLQLRDIQSSSNLGDFIISCSNDQSIRLSHAESGTGLCLLLGHTHVVEKVKFLPLHSNILIDKYLVENYSLYPNIPKDIITNPIYTESLGYKYCVSAGRDNSVKLWLLPPPVIRPHRPPLPSQFNNSQGWLIADLVGHQSWVKSIAIHPNGRFIFSAGDDKNIKIWDLESLTTSGKLKCISTLSGHNSFVNDLDFASFEIKSSDITPDASKIKEKTTEEIHNDCMKLVEAKIRCLFISGGTDSSLKLWI